MTEETAIERIKVLHAPPGSILLLCFDPEYMFRDIDQLTARIQERLPEYRVLIVNSNVDVKVIVPSEAPPVTNNYTIRYAKDDAPPPDFHVLSALKGGAL